MFARGCVVAVLFLSLFQGCTCGGAGPATGFTQVVTSPGSTKDGLHVSLVLDRDDSPMLAYLKEDTSDTSKNAVLFTRFDGAKGAWTPPLVVAEGLGNVNRNGGDQEVWLARDSTDGRLGIAFQKHEQICGPAGGNKEWTVHVAFSADQGATWSASERVSEAKYTRNDPVNGVEVCDTDAPRIAMHGGTAHVAWAAAAGEADGISFRHGYYHASSAQAGSWTRTLLPHLGDDARKGRGVLSLALDSAGEPAVAYALLSETSTAAYTTAIAYVRPGGTVVRVTDSANVQNDDPQVTLAFDGTKPRVGVHLTKVQGATQNTWIYRSDDGAAFTEATVPLDGTDRGGWYLDLDFVGAKGAFVYDFRSSGDSSACGGGPKVARSSDATSWTICGADDKTHQFLGEYVSAELAQSGKLIAAFWSASADTASPARFQKGIVLYREP